MTCFFCYIVSSMMVNALFDGTETTWETTSGWGILNYVVVGIISGILTFPSLALFVSMFQQVQREKISLARAIEQAAVAQLHAEKIRSAPQTSTAAEARKIAAPVQPAGASLPGQAGEHDGGSLSLQLSCLTQGADWENFLEEELGPKGDKKAIAEGIVADPAQVRQSKFVPAHARRPGLGTLAHLRPLTSTCRPRATPRRAGSMGCQAPASGSGFRLPRRGSVRRALRGPHTHPGRYCGNVL